MNNSYKETAKDIAKFWNYLMNLDAVMKTENSWAGNRTRMIESREGYDEWERGLLRANCQKRENFI